MQVPSAALEWAQESFGRCELGDECVIGRRTCTNICSPSVNARSAS